ncbi:MULTISPECIES: glycosyltransferase family 2 protein [Chryseobacterium]|uniref:Glycosyltransferase involved in cell wall biosynthesis n=1 Tax=Chryseobacterium rhizosphaerae TaxID=395937 RepID=A0AAE3YC50_9FLAO|nr:MULTISPECIES: glycosyltransferase [Chryseobacterium]MDC8098687.1 glycosyltransferase [Chryseobacterium rhizosphaerae]MDR6527423.1 glycosyltransferase involved in cell wall biosynthesis [Chryseobacterium rhizosphaerae]
MIKFSILIANYNNGKYFRDCYNSLVNQTYENWEAIIVDDASTDDSVEVIKSIIKDDPRFKLYHNAVNQGCGFTKRECMKYAEGELCAYLDPDDAIYTQALEKTINEFANTTDIVATYSQMMLCDDNLVPDKIFASTKQVYNSRYFFNCPIQFAHFFTFKKEAYLKTSGINPALRSAVDQDLYLKILEYGDVKYIKEPLYLYRLHSDGISQHSSKQGAKESFAKVIYDTMKRRGIKKINNLNVPETYTNSEEIYRLLAYQTSTLHRLINKIKVTLHL